MKFKGSYQKSILEGLELSKCTSYKKYYYDQHLESGSRYDQKMDYLSPMKSTMPLDGKFNNLLQIKRSRKVIL